MTRFFVFDVVINLMMIENWFVDRFFNQMFSFSYNAFHFFLALSWIFVIDLMWIVFFLWHAFIFSFVQRIGFFSLNAFIKILAIEVFRFRNIQTSRFRKNKRNALNENFKINLKTFSIYAANLFWKFFHKTSFLKSYSVYFCIVRLISLTIRFDV